MKRNDKILHYEG
ncbi:hypothetical protein M0O07_002078 [Escherichia coli]|nr:hypothetical protein [Escherichia coli]